MLNLQGIEGESLTTTKEEDWTVEEKPETTCPRFGWH